VAGIYGSVLPHTGEKGTGYSVDKFFPALGYYYYSNPTGNTDPANWKSTFSHAHINQVQGESGGTNAGAYARYWAGDAAGSAVTSVSARVMSALRKENFSNNPDTGLPYGPAQGIDVRNPESNNNPHCALPIRCMPVE
jgi:hypothetical protein